MNLLVFWIGTSVSSFCVEMANELRVFKDVADVGYKIDVKRMSELGNQLNPDGVKISFLTILIPVYNIIQTFKKVIQYNNIRPMLLDQLRIINVLEEMTEYEKEEYQQKPTGLNAIIIPLKTEIRLAHADSIKIKDEFGESEILYEIDENLEDMTILKVTGPASRLTVNEQKNKVYNAWRKLFSTEIEKTFFQSFITDDFMDSLPKDFLDELVNSKEDSSQNLVDKKEEQSTIKESFVSKKKRKLENLREELIRKKDMLEKGQEETGPKLTKKRK